MGRSLGPNPSRGPGGAAPNEFTCGSPPGRSQRKIRKDTRQQLVSGRPATPPTKASQAGVAAIVVMVVVVVVMVVVVVVVVRL